MTASTLRPDVVAFVASVRAHLDDLDVAEVEELTGGLAADLTDAAADHRGPLEPRFGPPQAYADELRSAAGLGPRGRVRRESYVEELRRNLGELGSALHVEERWPAVWSFLVTLRPAWWVLRGVVATWLVVRLTHATTAVAVVPLTIALVVVSVELGRGRWSGRRGLAAFGPLGNVLAAVLVLPMVASTVGAREVHFDTATGYRAPGLVADGEPVTNVFAYDAQGRPLQGVQLFDQRGRALGIDPGVAHVFDGAQEVSPVPATDVYGRRLLNVYPLAQQLVTFGDDAQGTGPVTAAPTLPVPPLVAVPPLREHGDGGAPTAEPTATGSPTTTPTGTSTGAPTGASTVAPTLPGSRPSGSLTAGPTASTPATRPAGVPTTSAPTSETPAPRPSRTR